MYFIQHASLRRKQRFADSSRMWTNEISLQIRQLGIGDDDIRKITETGIDAVSYLLIIP